MTNQHAWGNMYPYDYGQTYHIAQSVQELGNDSSYVTNLHPTPIGIMNFVKHVENNYTMTFLTLLHFILHYMYPL